MLIKVQEKLLERASGLYLHPKMYQNQSLYFEYLINGETLAISYNQKNKKIYFYFRNKQDISSFTHMLDGLNYVKYNHQLICDIQDLDLDVVINILLETLSRTVKYIDGLDIIEDTYSSEKMADIEKGLINFNLVKCVDRNIIRKIIELKERRFESHDEYARYLKYCCDIGFLELVYATFEIIDKNSIILDQFKKLEPSIERIQSFTEDPLIKDLQIRGLSNNKNLEDIAYYKNKLFENLNSIKPESTTHYNNMVLGFILTTLLRKSYKSLSAQEAIRVFEYICAATNMNSIRKQVCLLMIIEYCARNNLSDFFRLPQKWYNYTTQVLKIIIDNSILDAESKNELWCLYQQQVHKGNSFNISVRRKVAVCISGVYRNHPESLQSIKENILSPLQADVFIHTWDTMALWSGFGGSATSRRIFGVDAEKILPKEYYWLSKLEYIFPTAYSLLKSTINQNIDIKIFDIMEPCNIQVEDEKSFMDNLGNTLGYTRLRGIPNQIKMFNGIKKSFDMALSHSHYDYIIRCRPDILITEAMSENLISRLQNNKIYTSSTDVGLGDTLFIISSSMAYNFSRFIEFMYEKHELSPFDAFPEYDSHNLLAAWMNANNYSYEKAIIKGEILTNPKIPIPNLKEALYTDYSKLTDIDKKRFKGFVEYLIKRNG